MKYSISFFNLFASFITRLKSYFGHFIKFSYSNVRHRANIFFNFSSMSYFSILAETNSLIDWNSPAIECISKPLIPLPSSKDQIQIIEDNPFDAVERQINENEMFDLFNLSSSVHVDDAQEDACKCDKLIDHSVEERGSTKTSLTSNDEIIEISAGTTPCDNGNTPSESASVKNSNDRLSLDISNFSNFSSVSELKDMVRNRLSRCIEQLSHQSPVSDPSCQLSSSVSSITKYSSFLNHGFVLSKDGEISKTINSKVVKTSDEGEDIISIMPNWDEFVLSSSDEELENYGFHSNSYSEVFSLSSFTNILVFRSLFEFIFIFRGVIVSTYRKNYPQNLW